MIYAFTKLLNYGKIWKIISLTVGYIRKMKLLFIHLSDAHLRDKTYIDENIISAQVQAINSLGKFDKCCIVFSGDLDRKSVV